MFTIFRRNKNKFDKHSFIIRACFWVLFGLVCFWSTPVSAYILTNSSYGRRLGIYQSSQSAGTFDLSKLSFKFDFVDPLDNCDRLTRDLLFTHLADKLGAGEVYNLIPALDSSGNELEDRFKDFFFRDFELYYNRFISYYNLDPSKYTVVIQPNLNSTGAFNLQYNACYWPSSTNNTTFYFNIILCLYNGFSVYCKETIIHTVNGQNVPFEVSLTAPDWYTHQDYVIENTPGLDYDRIEMFMHPCVIYQGEVSVNGVFTYGSVNSESEYSYNVISPFNNPFPISVDSETFINSNRPSTLILNFNGYNTVYNKPSVPSVSEFVRVFQIMGSSAYAYRLCQILNGGKGPPGGGNLYPSLTSDYDEGGEPDYHEYWTLSHNYLDPEDDWEQDQNPLVDLGEVTKTDLTELAESIIDAIDRKEVEVEVTVDPSSGGPTSEQAEDQLEELRRISQLAEDEAERQRIMYGLDTNDDTGEEEVPVPPGDNFSVSSIPDVDPEEYSLPDKREEFKGQFESWSASNPIGDFKNRITTLKGSITDTDLPRLKLPLDSETFGSSEVYLDFNEINNSSESARLFRLLRLLLAIIALATALFLIIKLIIKVF